MVAQCSCWRNYPGCNQPRGADKTQPNGSVRSYRIDRATGTLTLINKAPTGDNGTTHIGIDHAGTVVAVCHYGGDGTSLCWVTLPPPLSQ